MLQDLGVEANNEEMSWKKHCLYQHIDSKVLRKVIDWCEQHKNDPEPQKEVENKYGERKQKSIMDLRAGMKISWPPSTEKEE